MEFSRRYDVIGPILTISLGNTQRDLRPQNAALNYSVPLGVVETKIQSKTKGFAGNNKHTVAMVADAGAGAEFVEINASNEITIHVHSSTTVQDVIDAIAAEPAVSSEIEIVTSNPTGLMNLARARAPLQNGLELWNFEGRLGFGYVNINEIQHFQNYAQTSTWGVTSERLSPLSYGTNAVAIKYFRGIDLSGAE
jgi:hypothetical protein